MFKAAWTPGGAGGAHAYSTHYPSMQPSPSQMKENGAIKGSRGCVAGKREEDGISKGGRGRGGEGNQDSGGGKGGERGDVWSNSGGSESYTSLQPPPASKQTRFRMNASTSSSNSSRSQVQSGGTTYFYSGQQVRLVPKTDHNTSDNLPFKCLQHCTSVLDKFDITLSSTEIFQVDVYLFLRLFVAILCPGLHGVLWTTSSSFFLQKGIQCLCWILCV